MSDSTKQELEQKKIERELLRKQRLVIKSQIKELSAQIEELENPDPVLWEPNGGRHYIHSDLTSIGNIESTTKHRLSGMERSTNEQAVNSAKELRRFARLLAYRDEFASGYVFDTNKKENFYVYFDEENKTWRCDSNMNIHGVQVYMTQDAANELVYKLNSGEVVL
jgi:hypothetical protein